MTNPCLNLKSVIKIKGHPSPTFISYFILVGMHCEGIQSYNRIFRSYYFSACKQSIALLKSDMLVKTEQDLLSSESGDLDMFCKIWSKYMLLWFHEYHRWKSNCEFKVKNSHKNKCFLWVNMLIRQLMKQRGLTFKAFWKYY